jgi:hypothetical protein
MPLDQKVLDTFLTTKKAAEIRDGLLHSEDPDEREIGRYIADYFPFPQVKTGGPFTIGSLAASVEPELEKVLDSTVRLVTKGGRTISETSFRKTLKNTTNWGLALLQRFFSELRTRVCGKGKKVSELGSHATAALSTLGVAICKLLGISASLATGVAVLTIIELAQIGKNALCKMTSPEELAHYFG